MSLLSVVIPVYNDPVGIQATLDSLLAQNTSHDYQITVADNDSTDRTPEVVQSYDDVDHNGVIRVQDNRPAGAKFIIELPFV
ncbi:MAG: glycosyltransferase [Desulfotignum sp.]